MQRIFLLFTALALIAVAFSCGGREKADNDAHGDTPTEAYKRLFAAVKSGDADAIKAEMTKKTLDLNRMGAQKAGKSEDQQIMHGMTSTTYSETVPEIRDERIKDNMGAVEVWDSKDSTWDDLPFMIEGGKWKFAMGDSFAGTYHSPGKGRDLLEKQAANALHPPQTPIVPNVNIPAAPSPKR
jgi:hypothetical protein